MTTYGFIGAGNMAGAIIRGMAAAGTDPSQVLVSDANADALTRLADDVGVRAATTPEVAAEADYLVLAVKPHVIPAVAEEIGDAMRDGQVLVSIAAGVTIERLSGLFPQAAAVVRVMPNVNAQIGEGVAAVARDDRASDAQVGVVVELFSSVGHAIELEERLVGVFSGIAGAGPALVYEFVDALARAGVKNGLPYAQALDVAARTVVGSARMVLAEAEGSVAPTQLTYRVTSPGGTTIAGLTAAEDAGFTPSVVRFVDGVVGRDRELGA